MRLADIVSQYAPALLEQYGHELLPGQRKALSAFQLCRGANAPKMLLSCDGCDQTSWLPHSCGNRHCPHCQAHESQRWIDKQLQKRVPGEYFMVTFTLPAEFRPLAWYHQRELYELIIRNAWATNIIRVSFEFVLSNHAAISKYSTALDGERICELYLIWHCFAVLMSGWLLAP